MAKMTRSQREWRPGQKKPARSIKVMFTSMVLSLEALVAFFATLAIFGHNFNEPTSTRILIWVLGLLLVVAFIVTPAFLKKSWGYTFGYVLQVLLLLVGLALPSMFFSFFNYYLNYRSFLNGSLFSDSFFNNGG